MKEGKYYFPFTNTQGEQNVIILSQLRAISNKRFIRKIGKLNTTDYGGIKVKLKELV